jgi:hypothetical protein
MRNSSEQGSSHTFRICNTYCFSTATMVTRTRLNVGFILTSPALLYTGFLNSVAARRSFALCQLDVAWRACQYSAAARACERHLTVHEHMGISIKCQGQDSKISSNKSKKKECKILTLCYSITLSYKAKYQHFRSQWPRGLRLCPACQRPACTCVSRPLASADKHMYVNGAVLRRSV